MIQANELRVGNLVKEALCGETIVTPSVLQDLLHGAENYEPILLTEEFLIKLGFENDGMFMELNLPARMTIRFYHGNCSELDITQDGKVISFKHGHLKYVHQVQNLVFALTGVELSGF